MGKNELVTIAMTAIADVISGCKIATDGMYEVVWLRDHFACRKIAHVNGDKVVLANLRCADINCGLTSRQWDEIRIIVRGLIGKGVIK